MTIVRYWVGKFSLFLHHTVMKNQAKMLAKNEKNLSSTSSEIAKITFFAPRMKSIQLIIILYSMKVTFLLLREYKDSNDEKKRANR